MPYDVVLSGLPAGVAVEPSVGHSDRLVKIATREFTSSEDGEQFLRRLEGFVNVLLRQASPGVQPSTIDHLVAVINRDRTARIYVNECAVLVRARMNRTIQAGEAVLESDLVDIDRLEFRDVDFPSEAGVVCLFSAGWRKGLFFDVSPLGPEGEPRSFDVAALLGSYMAYLRSQGVFKLNDADWDYLIERQWFPFATLSPVIRMKLADYAKSRLDLDALVAEARAAVLVALPHMVERWRISQFTQPHFDLLAHAAREFEQGDYVSCTSIVYPRIEGIMRTLHRVQTAQAPVQASQANLTTGVIQARSHEHHDFHLLLPDMFNRYLTEAYFASFTPGQPCAASRNSIGHGVATPEQFNEKAALMGMLTLDQVCFFLPENAATPPVGA